MATASDPIQDHVEQEYKWGFVTDIESDSAPPGLDEDIVAFISGKKHEPEWMLQWRLKAYRHWTKMKEPRWANVRYNPIDYQSMIYYSAPKSQEDGPKSLDEVDPELLKTYEKLGIPLAEQEKLAGVAVDAVEGFRFRRVPHLSPDGSHPPHDVRAERRIRLVGELRQRVSEVSEGLTQLSTPFLCAGDLDEAVDVLEHWSARCFGRTAFLTHGIP